VVLRILLSHGQISRRLPACNRLINKLSKAAGLPATTFNAKASSSFVAMSNIENFNNAAKAYGVPTTALFQTPDLYEGRKGPLLNVINCLNQLGFVVCISSLCMI